MVVFSQIYIRNFLYTIGKSLFVSRDFPIFFNISPLSDFHKRTSCPNYGVLIGEGVVISCCTLFQSKVPIYYSL